MSSDEVLDMRMRQAQKANVEWRWEFRRQQNLLKKQVEISLKKERMRKVLKMEKLKAGASLDEIAELSDAAQTPVTAAKRPRSRVNFSQAI